MIIKRRNPISRKMLEMEINITKTQLKNWKNGELAQNAFPNISADEREFIMTGLTPSDWEKIFGKSNDV